MKYILLIIGTFISMSCNQKSSTKTNSNYQEKTLSFGHLRFGFDKNNDWIKRPENILMVHETFKTIGYKNLISNEEWNNDFNWFLDVKKSPKNLIDSLILTSENPNESDKYYKEFWQRREKEGNLEVVYHVVKEIKDIWNVEIDEEVDIELVNDTLETLLSFEFPSRELSNEESNELLSYLIEIGMHESAYNIITGENDRFNEVNWSEDPNKLLKSLTRSETFQRPWFEDDTK